MAVNIAPLQTYQGPELDLGGSFLEGRRGALQREELQMQRDEAGRKQQSREQMQGILSQMGDNPDLEAAALKMLPFDPEMANTLLSMEANKQEGVLRAQDSELQAVKIAQEKIKQRKEQIALETKTALGAVQALDGVEEPAQKERIYSLYLKSIEDQGMQVPEDLKGGWSPENEQNLKDIAEMGQMMIDMDPSEKTSEIKNFEYSQRNKGFGEFFSSTNARELSGTEAIVEELRKEDPELSYSEALAVAQGLARKAQTIKDGKVVPLEGAAEAAETMSAADAEGKVSGTAMGEAKVKFEALKSNMPNLVAKTDKLYKLADIATYNNAGKLRDAFLRETGMEVTDAAEARARTIAIIDNEVLPLLRDTFGAAFTVKEGDWLKATMGDPDMSPKEKKAQIDAFIAGKKSELESLARRTGQEAPDMPESERPVDLENLSDAELEEMLKNAD
jgi:hypothetical protein